MKARKLLLFAALAVGLIGILNSVQSQQLPTTTSQNAPLAYAADQSGTLADIRRDPDLWRQWYSGFDGTVEDFACENRTPFMGESVYGEKLEPNEWPADRNWLFTTLVVKDPKTDPASQHLINLFYGHSWLAQLRQKSHFRVMRADTDPHYKSYFFKQAPAATLPAIVIQQPIENTGEGKPVYRVPVSMIPSHPDRLAYEISYAIRQSCIDGRCFPNTPNRPYQPQTPWQPNYPSPSPYQPSLPPFNPSQPNQVPNQYPASTGIDPTLLIVLLAVGGLALFFVTQRKG